MKRLMFCRDWWGYQLVARIVLVSVLTGCSSRKNDVVTETKQYSFDDIASQLAAEEAASALERED